MRYITRLLAALCYLSEITSRIPESRSTAPAEARAEKRGLLSSISTEPRGRVPLDYFLSIFRLLAFSRNLLPRDFDQRDSLNGMTLETSGPRRFLPAVSQRYVYTEILAWEFVGSIFFFQTLEQIGRKKVSNSINYERKNYIFKR